MTALPPAAELRFRLREEVVAAGGTCGASSPAASAGPPIANPFDEARSVEGTAIAVHPVGEPEAAVDVAFAEGMQRYLVVGWIGLVPVVRAYVAAAVLERRGTELVLTHHRAEECVVAPLARLPEATVDRLRAVGLPTYSAESGERDHPLVDVQLAVRTVEARRRQAEADVVRAHRVTKPTQWIVLDGSLRHLEASDRATPLLGVIKSHETQYLAGVDLERALTLPEGYRTSVFARGGGPDALHTWYTRLWGRDDHDILYGLVRVERAPGPDTPTEANRVSRWLMADRAPVAAADPRWDRTLYPMREVVQHLRARAGAWW